jgi:O-antigen/teichoic acid export membrane protein
MSDRGGAAAAIAFDSTTAPPVRHEALGAQVFRGSWISLVAQATQLAFRLVSTVVLARLLTPDAYGLVAMVTVVTGFISLFKSLGLATATVQAPRVSHAELNGLFWLNAAFGAGAFVVAVAVAPLLALVYSEPRVTPLVIGLSVTFLIGGLGVQHQALLRRAMRFGKVATIEISAMAIGTAAAILFASRGFGPWSLVGGFLVTEIANLVFVWRVVDWRPTRPRFDAKVGEMVALGRDLTQFNVLNYWARNLDNFLIGRFWGAAQLGLYNRAYQLLLLPLQQVTSPLSSVAIAALSRLNGEDLRYRQAYIRLLEKIVIVCMPMTTFLFVNAGPVVDLLLGPKWHEVAPVFMPLAVAGMVQPVTATFIWMLVSQGRRTDLRTWSIVGSLLSCGAIVAGMSRGVIGVAMFYAACELFVRAPLLAWFVGRRGPVRVSDVLAAIGPAALMSVAIFLACTLLSAFLPVQGVRGLGLSGLVALLAGGGVLLALPSGRRVCADLLSLIRPSGARQESRVEAVLLQER